jgi:uncharacterized SAM-binding protein YcdF (DUF218 family)
MTVMMTMLMMLMLLLLLLFLAMTIIYHRFSMQTLIAVYAAAPSPSACPPAPAS